MSHYARVYWTFFRNSLVREMSFRGNFLITVLTRAFWFGAQLTLFVIIFDSVAGINDWSREEYFAFMATGMLINSIVETFFMPNCANFSELIRTGNLDFALLKPIDTQFLISFEKVNLAMLNQVLLALALLGYALFSLHAQGRLGGGIGLPDVAMYVLLLCVGVAFFYSLMIALASSSIWFGRNQGLYDFWFYITVFARYPRSIYGSGPEGRTPSHVSEWTGGDVLQFSFTYVVPILLVVTVPARLLVAKTLDPSWITAVAVLATLAGLLVSRGIFTWSLRSYRSASS
ncbi:MAG: ABC transporter permease [Planctomycetaceae bacterium]